MRAVRLHAYDEHPRIDDVPEPVIKGPLDVIVRIGGAGVCRTDLHVMEGMFAERTGIELPYTLGHENAGWVHELGPGVTNLSVGDPVIVHPQISCGLCPPCRSGADMHCLSAAFPGLDTEGGFAELLRTSARSCVPLPRGVEPKDVAAQADAGLTAYHAAKKASDWGLLAAGTRTVVIGAGGLGHIGIQSLHAISPTEIIVVDRSKEALGLAAELGADHTILADGGHVDAVLELTDGRGAEVVIDYVGEGGSTGEGFAMLRRAGHYFLVGYGEDLGIPTLDIISTERNIIGNLVGTYNELLELMALAGQGKVTLHTREYPLEAAVDAIADLDSGRLRGRAILVP